MKSRVVSDLDIQALVDDELEGEERSRVLTALRHNPPLKTRYDQLVAQKRIIAAWSEETVH